MNMQEFRKTFPHLNANNDVMSQNIGKTFLFKNPKFDYYKGVFQVIGLQKTFDNKTVYRAINITQGESFGCPADPDDILFNCAG